MDTMDADLDDSYSCYTGDCFRHLPEQGAGDMDSCYAASFFKQVLEGRAGGDLIDVILCAEGKEIPCHRLVLTTCSDYFRAMFCGGLSESKKDKIDIEGVSAEALQLLVDFAYSGNIKVTTDNSLALFEAANMLQVKPVEQKCEEFLTDHMCPKTCLETWALTEVFCTQLSMKAKRFALKKFEEVCQTKEFLQLPVDFLKKYLSDEHLCAKKEERVLKAIMRWAKHDLEERQEHLKKLMKCVCFSRVDQSYLKNLMETDKIFSEVSGLKKRINKLKKKSRVPHRVHEEILVIPDSAKYMYRLIDLYCVKCPEGMDKYGYHRLDDLYSNSVHTAPLPKPESLPYWEEGIAACVLDNDVIVTGSGENLSEAWRYKTAENSWTRLGELKEGRSYHEMTTLKGRVYVVGGFPEGDIDRIERKRIPPLRDVEVYNEKTNQWRKRAPLKHAVDTCGLAACSGKLYVFGVKYDNWETSNIAPQCFDPTQNLWTLVSQVPRRTDSIVACTVNSKIYLVGGQLDCVLCYDPQKDCYEEMASAVDRWTNCSATVCRNEIVIISGEPNYDDSPYKPFSVVQCYNVSSNIMYKETDLPFQLDRHTTVTIAKY